jgi:hypothetical protein
LFGPMPLIPYYLARRFLSDSVTTKPATVRHAQAMFKDIQPLGSRALS